MTQESGAERAERRSRRARRIRSRVRGTAARPRLSVFRSNRHLFVQLVDDDASRTLLGLSDAHLPKKPAAAGVARAHALGKLLAARAATLGITSVVFDRGGYAYHGQVQAVADGAREGGLTL